MTARPSERASSESFLTVAIGALDNLGRKVVSGRDSLAVISSAVTLLSLGAAAFFVVRLITGQYQFNIDADNFAVGGLTFFFLMFSRLLVSSGGMLNSGLAKKVAEIADRIVNDATPDRLDPARRISKRMKDAAEDHRFEMRRGVGNLVILFIASSAILVIGTLAVDREWIRFVVTMGGVERDLAAVLACALAALLLILGRRDGLSKEEAFHKKIMGYVYGAIDDENLSGVGGPELGRALQSINERHRRTEAARLSYGAVRKRLGI